VSYQPADTGGAVLLAVQASRALAAAGQGDMVWGHASIRDPDGRGAWMKSAGWGLEEIDAAKVILVSPDGSVADGAGPRHIEYPIHTEIMAARPEVGSVVHTHSPAANEFAALDVPADRDGGGPAAALGRRAGHGGQARRRLVRPADAGRLGVPAPLGRLLRPGGL
jgi:ribulose-5-phosphate 4-epimerase/fuculose-1-phosphate aldolase